VEASCEHGINPCVLHNVGKFLSVQLAASREGISSVKLAQEKPTTCVFRVPS
jgi:hypothetical protein